MKLNWIHSFHPNICLIFLESYMVKMIKPFRKEERSCSIISVLRNLKIKIEELSTGMKQKASIAVSLVHDPDVVIFDEPTNGLDIVTARNVTDYLKLLKKEGKPSLFLRILCPRQKSYVIRLVSS